MGCTGPSINDAGIQNIRNIFTHPLPSQLQEKFVVPFVLWSTGWGVQSLTIGEMAGAMDLPSGPIVKAFLRAADKSKVMLTSFLRLTPVKDLQFALVVVLCIGRTVRPSQKNNSIAPLPPVYTFRDENLFRVNLQARHTKAVKSDDAEVKTAIWNEAAVEVFQGGYRDKHNDPLFQNLRNIMANSFNQNVARSFVRYMFEAYCTLWSVQQGDIRKEG